MSHALTDRRVAVHGWKVTGGKTKWWWRAVVAGYNLGYGWLCSSCPPSTACMRPMKWSKEIRDIYSILPHAAQQQPLPLSLIIKTEVCTWKSVIGAFWMDCSPVHFLTTGATFILSPDDWPVVQYGASECEILTFFFFWLFWAITIFLRGITWKLKHLTFYFAW